MRENIYNPDLCRTWNGNVSQCFTCVNKECNRNIFKKTKGLNGKEIAPGNPGVVLSKNYCMNRKEK